MTITGGIIYSSNSYLVQANQHGVEVTDMHTGFTAWLQGDKAAEIRAALDNLTGDDADDYLSRWI
jgi:hypothetical protein